MSGEDACITRPRRSDARRLQMDNGILLDNRCCMIFGPIVDNNHFKLKAVALHGKHTFDGILEEVRAVLRRYDDRD
jgi:hypothetical protein